MPAPSQIYTPENTACAFQLLYSVAVFWKDPCPGEFWLLQLQTLCEASQLRILMWISADFGSPATGGIVATFTLACVFGKQPNPFELYDMHGNVYEWCSDWYAEDYYASGSTSDPSGPGSGSSRVLRGARGTTMQSTRVPRTATTTRPLAAAASLVVVWLLSEFLPSHPCDSVSATLLSVL